MIRYALNCDQGHTFESWFASSAAYDKQAKRGQVACPLCGSVKVEKAIMAPNLRQAGKPEPRPPTPTTAPPMPPPALQPMPPKTPVAMMSAAERELRHKLKELRDHITKSAHYVGPHFPEEARKIHYGEVEHRSIYGEASAEDAKQLHDEGIEFHPLPILPDDNN